MRTISRAIKTTIRIPKEDAAFIYFQLESNEGICFYSTLESSMKELYRDILITCDESTKPELDHVLKRLEEKHTIIYL